MIAGWLPILRKPCDFDIDPYAESFGEAQRLVKRRGIKVWNNGFREFFSLFLCMLSSTETSRGDVGGELLGLLLVENVTVLQEIMP